MLPQKKIRRASRSQPRLQRRSMHRNLLPDSPSRRTFLAATSGLLAAAAAGPLTTSAMASRSSFGPLPEGAKKLEIGVFDAAFPKLSLDEMLDKFSAWGVEAVEIGTGGYPGSVHCPVQELLNDPAKLGAWKKKFEDHNIRVATLELPRKSRSSRPQNRRTRSGNLSPHCAPSRTPGSKRNRRIFRMPCRNSNRHQA